MKDHPWMKSTWMKGHLGSGWSGRNLDENHLDERSPETHMKWPKLGWKALGWKIAWEVCERRDGLRNGDEMSYGPPGVLDTRRDLDELGWNGRNLDEKHLDERSPRKHMKGEMDQWQKITMKVWWKPLWPIEMDQWRKINMKAWWKALDVDEMGMKSTWLGWHGRNMDEKKIKDTWLGWNTRERVMWMKSTWMKWSTWTKCHNSPACAWNAWWVIFHSISVSRYPTILGGGFLISWRAAQVG
jgi:hypothetical protein